MTPPTGEPNIQHELHRPDSNYDHYIEMYKQNGRITAVKKDSKPIHNEDTYNYKIKEGELKFQNGKHSCSGAGKFRAKTPSDQIDDKIKELATPLVDG